MEAITSPVPVDALVTAAAGGDRDAFARLVHQTRGLVASIAIAILRDVDASHDVAQDVFLAAWRDLRKLREPASFLPWLRQMTRNRAHHVLRSRVRERRVIPARLSGRSDGRERVGLAGTDVGRRGETDLLSIAVDAQSPAAALIADEDRRRLADAIDALPDEAREVVTLYYREGQSARQVAMLLGMREDTVKQRLSRARQRLRASLLDEVGETLRSTAPGAAFTASVMALTVAAPSTTAAAGLGMSMSQAAGSSLLLKILAAIGGALLGVAGGVAGVLIGTRRLQRLARDDQERQALRKFTIVAVCSVTTAGLSIPLGWSLTQSPWAPIASYIALLSALGVLYFGWLPRIIARRLEAELREEPDAARRHRRDRVLGYMGYIAGALSGGAGLIAGLWSVLTAP